MVLSRLVSPGSSTTSRLDLTSRLGDDEESADKRPGKARIASGEGKTPAFADEEDDNDGTSEMDDGQILRNTFFDPPSVDDSG